MEGTAKARGNVSRCGSPDDVVRPGDLTLFARTRVVLGPTGGVVILGQCSTA
jgi:hypothetical protein